MCLQYNSSNGAKTQRLKTSLVSFLNTIAKYDDLVLATKGKEMFITFDTDFDEKQSRIVEDILNNCRFLIT